MGLWEVRKPKTRPILMGSFMGTGVFTSVAIPSLCARVLDADQFIVELAITFVML